LPLETLANPEPMPDRRRFLSVLATMPAAAVLPAEALADSLTARILAPPHARVRAASVGAVADAVLPAEALGTDGVARAAAQFQRWLDGYLAGAERDHGYGTGELSYTPADPRPKWRAQLEELDAAAQAAHARAFDAVDRTQRRELVRARLEASGVDRLAAPLAAPHIAGALLSWFYASSEANDLCHQARIGKETCRPLSAVTAAPAPLASR
jgi:hypothetical protein